MSRDKYLNRFARAFARHVVGSLLDQGMRIDPRSCQKN